MKLTEAMIDERIRKEFSNGKTADDAVICGDFLCGECEMFNPKSISEMCRVLTENKFQKILRKLKLKKLLK